jgi:IS30 family transposase
LIVDVTRPGGHPADTSVTSDQAHISISSQGTRESRAVIPNERHKRKATSATPDPPWATHQLTEGDLIIGAGRSAIGTVVERATRFTMLVHLPRKEGWGDKAPIKNGPALGGYGAESMRDALTNGFSALPDQLCRSLTWDQGKELSAHAEFTVETGIPVFFADPHSPWQRGTNENTNGVLRQYFPKGTDLSRWSRDELEAVATTLNARPRKILGWRSPAEALDEHLRSLPEARVASTS